MIWLRILGWIYGGVVPLPFLVSTRVYANSFRRKLSLDLPKHPRLRELFLSQAPRLDIYDETVLRLEDNGHYHWYHHEILWCVHGAINVTMRLVDKDGISRHKVLRLERQAIPEPLVIPAGIHHKIGIYKANSVLFVYSSPHSSDAPEDDEIGDLPEGYDKRTSREFAIEIIARVD